MKRKKVLSLVLTLTLCAGLFTLPAHAVTVTEVVPCKYDNMGDFSEGLAKVELNGKGGYIDQTGREVVPCKYDKVGGFSEGLAAVELNGKYGFIDRTGKEVVPCKYTAAFTFSEGLAAVCVGDWKTGKWGYIDQTGREVISLKYDGANNFHEGLAIVHLNDGNLNDGSLEDLWHLVLNSKRGFVDQTGREVVPCKYDDVDNFSEGLAKVKLDGKYGFIDQTGREVIPLKYDFAGDFSEGLAAVELNDKVGFIDQTGREVTPLKYDDAANFSEGLAWVKLNGKGGLIDQTGKEVAPCKYDYDKAKNFSEGLAAVELNGKWGYIDRTGREVIPCKYSVAGHFSEGLVRVRVGNGLTGKWGYIDRTGNEVIPLKYNGATNFSEGLAVIATNDKVSENEEVLAALETAIGDASDAGALMALTALTSKYGFVDQTGNEVIPLKYDGAANFSEGLASVCVGNWKTGKWGFIDQTGREVVPCKYDGTKDFSEGVAKVKLNGKYGLLAITDGSAPAVSIVMPTAYPSTQTVDVDGKAVEFQMYALKDESGNLTNYVKLRDVASVLNGTPVQFNVGWDGAVNIEMGKAYVPNGSEMNTPFSGERSYTKPTAVTNISGELADLDAIVLTDDQGGGFSYYQLRDLGKALSFNVGWSADKGVFLETDRPYDPNN